MKNRCLWLVIFLLLVLWGCAAISRQEAQDEEQARPLLPPETTIQPRLPREVTFYVRMDGGSPEQCSGLEDAAYPGSGMGQPSFL